MGTRPVVPGTSYDFGARTTAGAGGCPVTGTTIASGANAAHWQIVGGYISPSPAGVTAGLNAAPYTLTLDNGQIVTLTVTANAMDIRTQTEWDALNLTSTSTLKGRIIFLRPDSYRGGASIITRVDGSSTGTWPNRLKNSDFLGLTIAGRTPALDTSVFPPKRSADPCTIDSFLGMTGVQNIAFRNLATTDAPGAKFAWKGQPGHECFGIVIDRCDIGMTVDPNGNYAISTNFPNLGKFLVSNTGSNSFCSGTVTITNCRLQGGDRNVELGVDMPGKATIIHSGNFSRWAYTDAFHFGVVNGNNPVVYCEDNYFTESIGLLNDSGGPHCDAIQGQGDKAATTGATIYIRRNRIIGGNSRTKSMHGMLFASFKLGGVDSGQFWHGEIIGNFYVGNHNDAITVSQAGNIKIADNMCVQYDQALRNNQVTIRAGGTGDATSIPGGQTIINNIADFINTANVTGGTVSNNLPLGQGGQTVPYSSVFQGTGGFSVSPTNWQEALARFTPIGSGAGKGPVPFVNWPTAIPGNDGSLALAA